MSAKKILFVLGDFAEDYEAMVPFQPLTALGHVVDAPLPEQKGRPKYQTAIHDFEGDQPYTEKPGHNFVLNAGFAEPRAKDYDALMIAGGRAPEYLRPDQRGSRLSALLQKRRSPSRRSAMQRKSLPRRIRGRRNAKCAAEQIRTWQVRRFLRTLASAPSLL